MRPVGGKPDLSRSPKFNFRGHLLLTGGMMSSHNDSFVASRSSPTVDFLCENHGSISLLCPVSPAAFAWIEEHLPPDRIAFGNAVAIDHRCIWAILVGLQEDGLVVSRG